jgi:hypothetical protein
MGMDSDQFDQLARFLGRGVHRRAAFATLAALAVSGVEQATAKHKHRRHRRCGPGLTCTCGTDGTCDSDFVLCRCGRNVVAICGTTAEGTTTCFRSVAPQRCEDTVACSSSAQCGAGQVCVVNSCCRSGAGICQPLCPKWPTAATRNARRGGQTANQIAANGVLGGDGRRAHGSTGVH